MAVSSTTLQRINRNTGIRALQILHDITTAAWQRICVVVPIMSAAAFPTVDPAVSHGKVATFSLY